MLSVGKDIVKKTQYDVIKKTIEGDENTISEDLRDYLRRRGIKIYTKKPFRSIKPGWAFAKFLNANDLLFSHIPMIVRSIKTVKNILHKILYFQFFIRGKFSSAKQASERISEVKSFWSEFENVRMNFFNNKFIRDIETDEYILKLDKIFSNKFYNFILIPPSHDTHQDHRKINEVANSIVRSSNIGLIEYDT